MTNKDTETALLKDQLSSLGWTPIKSVTGGYTFQAITEDGSNNWLTIVENDDKKNFSSSFASDMPLKLYTSTMALINQWLMPEEKKWVLFIGKDIDEDDMFLQIDEDGVSIDWDSISYSSDRLEELKGYYPRLEKVIDALKLEDKN